MRLPVSPGRSCPRRHPGSPYFPSPWATPVIRLVFLSQSALSVRLFVLLENSSLFVAPLSCARAP